MSVGRLFQISAPATGNARVPNVAQRVRGTMSCLVSDERKARRPGTLETGTKSARYDGAVP